MLLIKENEQKSFRFAIEVTGTELENTSARLVFEDVNSNKFFPLHINRDGSCEYQLDYATVRSLSEGRVYLEVVAESMVFKPWEDEFRIHSEVPEIRVTESFVETTVTTPIVETKKTTQTKKPVVTETKQAPVVQSKKPVVQENTMPAATQHPMYAKLLAEYKAILKQNKVSFIMGESKDTVAKKKKAIGELYKKYGKPSTAILEHFTKTKIDELLIL